MPPVRIFYTLFVDRAGLDVPALIEKHSGGKLRLIDSPDQAEQEPGVIAGEITLDERPVPPDDALAYFGRGLDEESAARLKNAQATIRVFGFAPFDSNHAFLKSVTLCVEAIAQELDAFVVDEADALTFTADAFSAIRAEEIKRGELSDAQFGIRAYRVEGGLRCVSMGLEKFGQANFGIGLFFEHHMGKIDPLFRAVVQTVIESPQPVETSTLTVDLHAIENPTAKQELLDKVGEGGSGRVTLEVDRLTPTGGDPEDLLGILFDNESGPALEAEQATLLIDFFGAEREVSHGVEIDQLDVAIAKARMEALAILEQPSQWDVDGRRITLATALVDANEVVWVEVEVWHEGQGHGILLSQPNSMPDMQSGSTIAITMDSIMDFKLYHQQEVILDGGVDEMVKQMQAGG